MNGFSQTFAGCKLSDWWSDSGCWTEKVSRPPPVSGASRELSWEEGCCYGCVQWIDRAISQCCSKLWTKAPRSPCMAAFTLHWPVETSGGHIWLFLGALPSPHRSDCEVLSQAHWSEIRPNCKDLWEYCHSFTDGRVSWSVPFWYHSFGS